jgi:hypothetical protein
MPTPTTAQLIGAGDIADCTEELGRHAEDTARLLDSRQGTVFAAGDLAYSRGSTEEFANCYGPRWGRHKFRTRPAAGNHEYESPGAVPYYNYFGEAAGRFGEGYYSYTLGNWHIVVLNSNIPATSGSAQLAWLRLDLLDNPSACTLAYWHHPRFTSGPSGGGVMLDAWLTLYELGVDVVINGHDHGYERFAPQDPSGRPDPSRGIAEFVIGTGGKALYAFGPVQPNSQRRISAFGIGQFLLLPTSYEWSFIEAGTEAIRDFGSANCH